jgi:hypothetical protein
MKSFKQYIREEEEPSFGIKPTTIQKANKDKKPLVTPNKQMDKPEEDSENKE